MKTPRIDTTELAEHIEKAARGVIGARADLAILDLVDRVGVEVRERLAKREDVRDSIREHVAKLDAGDLDDPEDVYGSEQAAHDLLDWIYRTLAPIGSGSHTVRGDLERAAAGPDPDDARDAFNDREEV